MNPREFCRERGFTTAILLTYDFEALFFERVALRELWAGDTGDILVLADAGRLSQSLQNWHGQLQHLGRRYQLAPSIAPARFHPKIMLRLGRDGGAVWLGSGNQTFAGWGGNQELCCGWTFGTERTDNGSWVPRLLERIRSWSPPGLQFDIINRATELPWLQSLPTEDQIGPETILTSYETYSLASQLQRRWAGRRFTQVRVFTGSTDEDGAFLAQLHNDFGVERSLVILDESRASFRAEQLRKLPLEVRVMKLPGSTPMHAKFYWFDGPDGPAAVMGSANCSAAAWLLAPQSGGNIEAVAVYDNPEPEQFAEVLRLFESENLADAHLAENKLVPTANDGEASAPFLSELSWDSTLGEVRVKFNPSAHEITNVFLEFDVFTVEMTSFGERDLWCGEVAEIADRLETMFVRIKAQLSSGDTFSYWRWLNDLVELRHASRGRHIADALNLLSKHNTSDEQQKIVASLQRISLALLSEPESFPDPVIRSAPTETGSVQESQVTAIDPDEFVRSIGDPESPSRARGGARENVPLSLIGVMRALFPPEEASDLADEADFADEPEEGEDKKKKPKDKTEKKRPTAPVPRYKQKLREDVERLIQGLNQPEFAAACTVTQLVQSCAFPIAVVTDGKKGGWVDPEDAAAWTNRIFDVLFIERQHERGLLEKVRVRYKAADQEMVFLKIVGDGTLWVTLLSAVSSLPPSLPKALALRSILKAKELIASTSAGRIETLLGRLHKDKARAIVEQAAEVSNFLSALEKQLEDNYESLRFGQDEARLGCDVGDVLWKPGGGWAESQANGTWGSNLNVHLHLKASTTLVSGKLFINVTKNPHFNSELGYLLEEM